MSPVAPRPAPVAVTGATGAVGGRVARQLHAAGVPLRLVVRDASRAPVLEGGAEVQVVEGLTGPEALTLAEVAGLVSELGGRGPVVFHDETIDEAYASRASYGAPPWQLDAWVSTYTAIATGELARTTGDVERLTGHPPRSLRSLLEAARAPQPGADPA